MVSQADAEMPIENAFSLDLAQYNVIKSPSFRHVSRIGMSVASVSLPTELDRLQHAANLYYAFSLEVGHDSIEADMDMSRSSKWWVNE